QTEIQIKNMLLIKNKTLVVIVIALGITLSACGGGSSSDTSSTNSTDQNNAQDQAEQDTPAAGDETPPATEETAPPDPVQSNQRPTARVTASQQVTSGETVTLDGSGSSDPDGDTLNFIWSQTQGSSIGLVNVANPTLSFIAPSVEQATSYSFQLQVSDGELSDSAAISITVTPMVDSTPPTIVARVPQPSATDVSVTTSISVDFDEPLLESLINSQSLQLSVDSSPVSASVSYDDQNNRLSLTPDAALTAATTYTVTLAGNLQDLAGNPVESVNWNFTTGSQYNLGETPQSTIDLCMSTGDKVMLSLINNARAVARSCGTSNYPAAPSLAWHCSLEQAAQGHSTSMADNNFFDHTGLDESDPGDRITAAGYIWRTYGENIAAGYPDEESAVSALLDSPGHCANIMNPGFSEVGTAVAENSASTYVIYWTQNFADRF
ncbi:MAG: Ig-like domain-containing protein, partial [Candidatus Thiodiazotropha endolucinida]